MKYMVFTTKHHDGFCMFDTKQTDYNIMQLAVRPRRGEGTGRRLPASRACASAPTTRSATGIIPTSRSPARRQVNASRPNLDRYEQYLHGRSRS